VQGVQPRPKRFGLVKIRAKYEGISENYVQTSAKVLYVRMFKFSFFGQVRRNLVQSFFLRSFCLEFFSSKFAELWAKVLRTPKIFLLYAYGLYSERTDEMLSLLTSLG